MQLIFMGTGTSHGVPVIACDCPVCISTDPRDRRTRSSIWIHDEHDRLSVLVDTATEFRLQALREGVTHLDAVLYTHAHADHVLGLDDIRRFNHFQPDPVPLYGSAETLSQVREMFGYIFRSGQEGGGKPQVRLREIDGQAPPLEITGRGLTLSFTPLPAFHGKLPITGYRFGNAAYLTDCNHIPDETMTRLQGLDLLILNALRLRPHPTHFNVREALQVIAALRPRRAYLTHLTHEIGHRAVESELPDGVYLAYDGLRLDVKGYGGTGGGMCAAR